MLGYSMIVISLILYFIFHMVYLAHHDTINYRSIYDSSLPLGFDGFQVFFISDIHRRRIKESTLETIENTIDIVVIGGDLTEKGVPYTRIKNNLKKLKRWNVPIYFVWGNNDYESEPAKLFKLLINENVIILANSNRHIVTASGDILCLLGLDCCKYKEARMDVALQNAVGDYFILLTHAPSAFYDLEPEFQKKAHTVLAGHTHGGQIRILGHGPYQRGGLEKYYHTNILVSEGYGYTMLPFRLGTRSESHVITFKHHKE